MALAVHSPFSKVIEPESSARKISTATVPLSLTASVSKTKSEVPCKAKVWLTEVNLDYGSIVTGISWLILTVLTTIGELQVVDLQISNIQVTSDV